MNNNQFAAKGTQQNVVQLSQVNLKRSANRPINDD